MDIDNSVNQIVQNLVSEINAKVQLQVAELIDSKINEIVANLDTSSILANQLSQKLEARISQLPIDAKSIEAHMLTRLETLSSSLSASIQTKAMTTATESINAQINRIDFQQLCQAALTTAIQNQSFSYPVGSIPATALDTATLVLSGDNIESGIIKHFGSTGIDDKATACQLTILDDVTVVENNLLTKDLTVKGTVVIEGDLNVTGQVDPNSTFYVSLVNDATNNVRTGLDKTLYDGYSEVVFDKIKTNGLDLTKITVDGQVVIDKNALGNHITVSNLQQLGQLKELQVKGESLLSETLYVTQKRVGVNTIEPSQALSVWDQEIEIGFGKKSTNVAVLGTPRTQTLVLSSNGKENLTLTPDGAASANKLRIGEVTFESSNAPPTDDKPVATIVFNSNPTLGGPLGWVSLGGARWANFGVID